MPASRVAVANSRPSQPATAMNERHAAFGQPLVGHPRLPGAGEAEGVFADHLARCKHFVAGGDVPESAGIAEHVAAAGKQQNQPDREEETRMREREKDER